MTTVQEGPGELKLQELVSAIEDAIEGANLQHLSEDTLRDLEMRLASVCGLLGIERMIMLDPMREERVGDEFGDVR